MGVAESTYRDWENGRKIQGEPYVKLAEILEINILALLGVTQESDDYLKTQLAIIEECVKKIRKIESQGHFHGR